MCIAVFPEYIWSHHLLKRLYQFNEGICLVYRLALNLIQRLLTKRRSHTIILQGDRIELVGAFSYWWDTRDFRCWKRRRGSSRKEAWVEGRPPGETAVQTAAPAPAFSCSACLNGYWRGQIKGLVIMVRENKEKDLGGDLMRQGLGYSLTLSDSHSVLMMQRCVSVSPLLILLRTSLV